MSYQTNHAVTSDVLPGALAEKLLHLISQKWGKVTTIVLHGGSVFEYKGPFPTGAIEHGFFNFGHSDSGFQGHLKLKLVDHISFQDKLHRGRRSYAFVFKDHIGACIFKIFLGRDQNNEVIRTQLIDFNHIRQTLTL